MLEYMKNALESLQAVVKRCVNRVHEALLRLPPLENLLLQPRNPPSPPEKEKADELPKTNRRVTGRNDRRHDRAKPRKRTKNANATRSKKKRK
jgi:hypothetical protein